MKNLMDCTLRELYVLAIATESLVEKVKNIEIGNELETLSCTEHRKACCESCKWYNKGIKNMAYCAMNSEDKTNPEEDVCDKYE